MNLKISKHKTIKIILSSASESMYWFRVETHLVKKEYWKGSTDAWWQPILQFHFQLFNFTFSISLIENRQWNKSKLMTKEDIKEQNESYRKNNSEYYRKYDLIKDEYKLDEAMTKLDELKKEYFKGA